MLKDWAQGVVLHFWRTGLQSPEEACGEGEEVTIISKHKTVKYCLK